MDLVGVAERTPCKKRKPQIGEKTGKTRGSVACSEACGIQEISGSDQARVSPCDQDLRSFFQQFQFKKVPVMCDLPYLIAAENDW